MNAVTEDIRQAVGKELASANSKFPMFASLHEGYAVLKEEVEEAGEELSGVRKFLDYAWQFIRSDNRQLALEHVTRLRFAAQRLAEEAVQVAAMAQKMIDSEKGGTENE